jgi:hypothetical protein
MKCGSLLAKASFALLVAILACLIYIIAQLRERAREVSKQESPVRAAERQLNATLLSGEDQAKPQQFAPFRPRSNNVAAITPPRPAVAAVLKQSDATPEKTSSAGVAANPIRPTGDVAFNAFAGGASGSAASASLSGRVMLRGTPPPETSITPDALCARAHPQPLTTHHFVVGEGSGLGNVFVYVKTGAPATKPPSTAVLLDQVGCEYQPYVAGVQVSQLLTVRNSDPLLHNVHMTSALNSESNVGQPVRGQMVAFRFSRPEVFLKFKCDVHPWMFAYVGVVNRGWFTVTDLTGKFALPPGLPAGRYTVAAVHQKLGELTQDISLPENAQPIEFTFDIPESLTRAR